MMKQFTNKITGGIIFIADFIKEEDLVTEAWITLVVLTFLLIIL